MTARPVFIPKDTKPYYKEIPVEFEWNPGQAKAQKVKNVAALHKAWTEKHPDKKILEVSTKSLTPAGEALSPFHLARTLPSLKKEFPVETIYQASKVFKHGGPFVDLLGNTPSQAKRDPRLQNSGELIYFQLEGKDYPASPDILYYNWLYLCALKEHPGLARDLLKYDSFSDIEFNPSLSRNCQARACAIYASLYKKGLLDQVDDFESFKKLFLEEDITVIPEQSVAKPAAVSLEALRNPVPRRKVFSVGQWIEHPTIGKGEVIRRTPENYIIRFRVSGPKTLAREFVERNCRLIG